MSKGKYYLSSLDSKVLETVRICEFVAVKTFESGKKGVLARVDPPISGQPFGLSADVSEVVLAPRHENVDLLKIREFPCFVHVARILTDNIRADDDISTSGLENLAWGELYRSRSDAANHVFD